VQAALRFAAGPAPGSSLSAGLCFLCEQLAEMTGSPIASAYVLEGSDDLVLRGTWGYQRDVIGEVRLKVGQGITGTCVEAMRPVTVDDARVSEQFEYFPQLAEERFPAFLAVPLLSGGRPRGALVLQRESGPFSEEDMVLAAGATRALTALIEAERPEGAHLILKGEGNQRGRTLGLATLLSRALPRRDARHASPDQLTAAFAAVREEILALAERSRAVLAGPCRELEEVSSAMLDARVEERAHEHLAAGVAPALALERIAAEVARSLGSAGPAARRAVDVEAFLGSVAHRLSGIEAQRVRRGELLVAVQLSGLAALRGWNAGVTGAVCATAAAESTGAPLLTALGLPVVSGVRAIFESVTQGDRVAIDAGTGEVIVNPSAAQAAAWRK
jgi:phosphotransferase system enzyme I (PtsP)